ncbi:MAG: S-methyl-5'-thioinosine phosphorylase [Gammaproteobacteria bacterium]
MSKIAIIGGTGLTSLNNLTILRREIVQTPYGEPSGPLTHGKICGTDVIFLARHGYGHTIPPHKVNYRANLWALHEAGAAYIIAVNAVGGISTQFKPTNLSIPDQLIDYTYSRKNTYFEEGLTQVVHVDFTEPYCEELRQFIISKAKMNDIELIESATYAATQGPRLESIAEINKLEKDGCNIVGMTGMPETALARELEMCYASIAVVANYAAGKSANNITMEIIEQNLTKGMVAVKKLLEIVIPKISCDFKN